LSNELLNWPREPKSNRLLCAQDHPMPENAPGFLAHTNIETVGSDSCFDLGQEYDRCRCKDCGLEWWCEVAQ
jgi:hypothetical protein